MKAYLFANSIIILPIFALAINLLYLPIKVRKYLQILFSFFWLALCVSLLSQIPLTKHVSIYFGAWLAPFGIQFLFNWINALLLTIFSILTFSVTLYCFQDIKLKKSKKSFYIGYWLLMLGIVGILGTRDIFNFYVWTEIILTSSIILLNSTKQKNIVSIAQYTVFNIIGTLLMLLAIAMIYSSVGSLNYFSIGKALANSQENLISIYLFCFIASILLKSAIFPLYFWLPKAYPATATSSVMLLAGLVTKAMMFALLNFFIIWHLYQFHSFVDLLLILACLTMYLGVMGAANQFNIKKILTFHIISQLGYILLATLISSVMGFIAMIYFLIHNIIVKSGLLMTSGYIENAYGTTDFEKLGNIAKINPWLSTLFIVFAFSLAGLPPLSGFWAKFLLIKASLSAQFYIATAVAIFVSLFTLYSMLKIWRFVYCENDKPQNPEKLNSMHFTAFLPVLILFLLMIGLSIFPSIVIQPMQHFAHFYLQSFKVIS